ncbi:MAG: hypothetical protein HKM28_06530 [Flavobacteriaceae bacterium]|nr:hypothetical protein [Flavobacteriaceae bacterium]
MKKYLVLGILFLLPISVYIFFASGVNNFVKLPVLTENVMPLDSFVAMDQDTLQFDDKITVLCFFGKEPMELKANAYNLTHKIYKKNYQFKDFQFVVIVPEGSETQARELKKNLQRVEDAKGWHFGFGTESEIEALHRSLQTDTQLNDNLATSTVFIIDKDGSLRGRNDDEDEGILYGFDSTSIAEINNKMSDDIKVVLAEYRLALKKYKANREI